MKKLYAIVIMLIIITMLTGSSAFAGNKTAKIKVTVNNKTVKYNVTPYLKNGEVMIPVKQTAKALGATVVWDKKESTHWVTLDMMHMELPVGKSEFYIHRDADFSGIPETVKLNTAIKRVKGETFVPAKKFVKSLGATVTWNSKKGLLSITKAKSTNSDLSYKVLTYDNMKDNDKLSNWYNENSKKRGISYKKDGKYIYALISAGEKPTGGYTITIDNAFYSSKDTVTINAKVTPPADNISVITVITYPAILIRIESNSIKSVIGEVIDTTTSSQEK